MASNPGRVASRLVPPAGPHFSISPQQVADVLAWSSQHRCDARDFYLRFSFATGIGMNTWAGCSTCKEELDVSDYKGW